MQQTLQPGLKHTFEYQVTDERTVPALLPEAPEFSRMPKVLATGYLVALVEWACMQLLTEHLDVGEGSVGTQVDLSHEAPTLPGHTVRFELELTEVAGRQLTFRVCVADGGTVVCRGTHRRAVIDLAKFESKLR